MANLLKGRTTGGKRRVNEENKAEEKEEVVERRKKKKGRTSHKILGRKLNKPVSQQFRQMPATSRDKVFSASTHGLLNAS